MFTLTLTGLGEHRPYVLTFSPDENDGVRLTEGTADFAREIEHKAYAGDDDGCHRRAYTPINGELVEVVVHRSGERWTTVGLTGQSVTGYHVRRKDTGENIDHFYVSVNLDA
jgi:hypothetical protein